MSFLLAHAYCDRVELLTDAAVFHDDGRLCDIRSKVWRSSRVPMAITGRGNHALIRMLAIAIQVDARMLRSFDKAVAGFERHLSRVTADVPHAEIIIVGISEERGPVVMGMQTTQLGDVPAMKLFDLRGFAYGGPEIEINRLCYRLGLEEFGVWTIEEARRMPARDTSRPDAIEIHGVGGFAELTVVGPAGVESRVLKRWPDVVGSKIEPPRRRQRA